MLDLKFDHYTFKVKNLEVSTSFYKTILGLKEIENRTRKDYIRWLKIGNGIELHIVEGNLNQIHTTIGLHLAFRMKKFDEFLSHLKANNIATHDSAGRPDNITIRADGIRQVYFRDPDGYWIEVNEAAILQ